MTKPTVARSLRDRDSTLQNAFQFAAATQSAPARIDLYGDLFPAEWGGIDETVIADALAQIGAVAEIDLHVNSRGGSVFTGWAIRNLLAQHAAKKNVFIDGVAASSAATIAMTLGGPIHMPANALVMFHESQIFAYGSKTAIAAQLQQVTKIDEACITLFMQVTGKSQADIAPLFSDNNETWMNAADAKAFGFPVIEVAALPAPKLASEQSTQSLFAFRHAPATAVAFLNSIPDGATPIMAKEKPTTPTEDPTQTANTPAPSNPATPSGAEPTPPAGAGVTQQTVTTPAPAPAPQTVTMTKEELGSLITNTVKQALADQKASDETEEIVAVCQLAGCSPEQSQKFIAGKFTLAEVRQTLAAQLNGKSQPPAQGASGGDPYQKYRDAYQADEARFKQAGITVEQFIKRRCEDDGIDPPAAK